MIRIAIVDDEKRYVEQIREIITEIFESTKSLTFDLSTYTDSKELINDDKKYDLLLLDIDMPDVNGFEIVDLLNRKYQHEKENTVIYISNYDNLVFESFKYSPMRFVRKKHLCEEMDEAINAWINRYLNNNECFMFTEKNSGTVMTIRLDDIYYFESYGHDICLADEDKKEYIINRTSKMTLNYLEERFSAKGFIRSHKSYLVNYRHIFKIHNNKIYFTNGLIALITIRKAKEFKVKFQELVMRE